GRRQNLLSYWVCEILKKFKSHLPHEEFFRDEELFFYCFRAKRQTRNVPASSAGSRQAMAAKTLKSVLPPKKMRQGTLRSFKINLRKAVRLRIPAGSFPPLL
ncbi:MAG: hypothetical protein II189_06815, partial [Lachnospiraceae bacterium]|nr:hypothetical protein [Lachnospiraceae bacterium]